VRLPTHTASWRCPKVASFPDSSRLRIEAASNSMTDISVCHSLRLTHNHLPGYVVMKAWKVSIPARPPTLLINSVLLEYCSCLTVPANTIVCVLCGYVVWQCTYYIWSRCTQGSKLYTPISFVLRAYYCLQGTEDAFVQWVAVSLCTYVGLSPHTGCSIILLKYHHQHSLPKMWSFD